MTTPFPFTSGQTLTAAQMNAITTLPINDETASYTLVVGDVGNRVIMNVASANTVTVNNNVFGVSDQVQIINKGAGTTTITAGAGVTINSASGLTLVQYQSGTLIALSASTFLFVKEDVTVSAGGLVFITGATFTTATSVSLPTNTFTSTYRNYRVIFTITATTGTASLTGRYRTSGTDNTSARYFQMSVGINFSGTTSNQSQDQQTSFALGNVGSSAYPLNTMALDFHGPQVSNISKPVVGSLTFFDGSGQYIGRHVSGVLDTLGAAFSVDSFTFISSVASSISGIYRVYGYADS